MGGRERERKRKVNKQTSIQTENQLPTQSGRDVRERKKKQNPDSIAFFYLFISQQIPGIVLSVSHTLQLKR